MDKTTEHLYDQMEEDLLEMFKTATEAKMVNLIYQKITALRELKKTL